MSCDPEFWREELKTVDDALSSQLHEMANCLNEMLLQIAVMQSTSGEDSGTELVQLQSLGQKAGASLHVLQASRNRIRQLLANR